MNWSDVEYLLQRTYLQGRSHSSNLLNRENALSRSTAAALQKTAAESLESQRKLLELGQGILDSIDPISNGEEYELTADALCRLEEDFLLMLAKHHKLSAATGARFTSKTESNDLGELESKLAEILDPESITVAASYDSALADLHEEYQRATGAMDCDEVVPTRNESLTSNCGSFSSNNNGYTVNVATNNANANPFMTAKQALGKNIGNRPTASTNNNYNNNYNSNASGTGYNPAVQTRRLLGGKRPLPNDAAQNKTYRDEGRDINTEFRYKFII